MGHGNADSSRKHCEFVVNRIGLGRGGEHLFLRWLTTHWDYFFNGADTNWTMIKTYSDQCMLIFCDRYLYCLCPFMSFAYYFMFGGLYRANLESATMDFVFPYLHSTTRENVARRLTNVIRNNIDVCLLNKDDGKKRLKAFTSKSLRKGSMTENRLNPELTIEHEYERSGHVLADFSMNRNAEGYIGSCPAKNAPGGLAMAGYQNPHVVPYLYSFDVLSHVQEAAA